MSDMTSFSIRLKEARLRAGLSQEALAKKLGKNQGFIGKLENGDRKATASTARLADALGVNPLWLEAGIGPMVSPPRERSSSRPSDVDELIRLYLQLPAIIRLEILAFVQFKHLQNTAPHKSAGNGTEPQSAQQIDPARISKK